MNEQGISELRSELRTCVVLLMLISVGATVGLTIQTWAMMRYAAALERISDTQERASGQYASKVQTMWDNHMLQTSRRAAETIPEWGAQHRSEVVGMVEALKD